MALDDCVVLMGYRSGHPANIEDDGFGYTDYNRFGPDYWMLDVDMDCDVTEGGWFEFKVRSVLTRWRCCTLRYHWESEQQFDQSIIISYV